MQKCTKSCFDSANIRVSSQPVFNNAKISLNAFKKLLKVTVSKLMRLSNQRKLKNLFFINKLKLEFTTNIFLSMDKK